jgi:hypothetical protein
MTAPLIVLNVFKCIDNLRPSHAHNEMTHVIFACTYFGPTKTFALTKMSKDFRLQPHIRTSLKSLGNKRFPVLLSELRVSFP